MVWGFWLGGLGLGVLVGGLVGFLLGGFGLGALVSGFWFGGVLVWRGFGWGFGWVLVGVGRVWLGFVGVLR